MQTQLVRTTVQIDPELYRNVKLKMVQDDLTFKEIVEKSLTKFLQEKPKQKKKSTKKVRFGGYHLGGIKGNLSRKEIYDEIEEGIV